MLGEIVIETAIGLLVMYMAYRTGWQGEVGLLHWYHTQNVMPEKLPAFARRMGQGLMAVGAVHGHAVCELAVRSGHRLCGGACPHDRWRGILHRRAIPLQRQRVWYKKTKISFMAWQRAAPEGAAFFARFAARPEGPVKAFALCAGLVQGSGGWKRDKHRAEAWRFLLFTQCMRYRLHRMHTLDRGRRCHACCNLQPKIGKE